jgi:putative ABC transport system permease protein
MGIPILKGREFTDRDTAGAPGAIVINDSMARAFWPKQDPIGRAIRLGGVDGPRLTVVGVAGDVRFQGLETPAQRQFYRPYMQAGWPVMTLVIRTNHAPSAFAGPVTRAVAGVLPDWPVSGFQTMDEVVHNSTGSRRFPMLLLGSFSALALALAAVGIAGVVGHSVTQRTQEIGLRMALGAGTPQVLRLVVSGNMLWVLAGIAVGMAGAAGLTHLLTGLLYEVRPLDPTVMGAVSFLLAGVALFASYLPARRAAKIDPIAALRCD